jgi:hypothetical protein
MTERICEILFIEGKKTYLPFCPPIPQDHPRISKSTGKRYILSVMQRSTACWRGYQGTWEIKAGRLYLKDLQGSIELKKGKPVLADWFSGVLSVPKGNMLKYVHMGFGSVFEETVLLTFKKGVLVSERTIDICGTPIDEPSLYWDNSPSPSSQEAKQSGREVASPKIATSPRFQSPSFRPLRACD